MMGVALDRYLPGFQRHACKRGLCKDAESDQTVALGGKAIISSNMLPTSACHYLYQMTNILV